MRSIRLLIISLCAVLSCLQAAAQSQTCSDLQIEVVAADNGAITVTETWSVKGSHLTEWYLVRKNLGDIEVKDLKVTNEEGVQFENEGEWNIDRSAAQKQYKCGIVHKSDGVEICWGFGVEGRHVFTATYTMTNAVKSLHDSDCLHMQFVSPGLSAPPQHVRLEFSIPGVQLDTLNANLWGFGFYGNAEFADGKAVYESSEPFQYKSSLIALIRFDKGLLHPVSVIDQDFSERLATAKEGSNYDQEEDDGIASILGFLACIFSFCFIAVIASLVHERRKRARILGEDKKLKNISWCRDVPFGGDLKATDYTLVNLGLKTDVPTYTSALIVRLIQQNMLSVSRTPKGKIDIYFTATPEQLHSLDAIDHEFYDMLVNASGTDHILQDKEFSRWAKRHTSELTVWTNKLLAAERDALHRAGLLTGKYDYSRAGQAEAVKAVGFKKFLTDFTLIKERTTPEVALWQDYLVFGALFGIADKVAMELQDIDPRVFEQAMPSPDFNTTYNVLRMTRSYGSSVYNAAHQTNAAGSRGVGGHTSFGGGGGFSGGGFGGGGR